MLYEVITAIGDGIQYQLDTFGFRKWQLTDAFQQVKIVTSILKRKRRNNFV